MCVPENKVVRLEATLKLSSFVKSSTELHSSVKRNVVAFLEMKFKSTGLRFRKAQMYEELENDTFLHSS